MNELRAMLLAMRAEIAGTRRDISVPDCKEEIERMERFQLVDLEARLAEYDAARVRSIDAALMRIEEGTFGKCVDCERPISPARLRALPTAEQCIVCAERSEVTCI